MKSKSSENIDNQSGGTAAKISYSPEELAEVFMTSRPDFLILDLEEITLEDGGGEDRRDIGADPRHGRRQDHG